MLHGEWRYFRIGNMFDQVKFTEDGLGQGEPRCRQGSGGGAPTT